MGWTGAAFAAGAPPAADGPVGWPVAAAGLTGVGPLPLPDELGPDVLDAGLGVNPPPGEPVPPPDGDAEPPPPVPTGDGGAVTGTAGDSAGG